MKIKPKDDKRIGYAIATLLFSGPIVTFINDFTNFFGITTSIDTIAVYGIIGIIVIMAVPAIFRRIGAFDYIFLFLVLMIFFLNYAIFPENQVSLGAVIKNYFPYVLPFYFLGRTIKDVDVLFECIRPIAIAALVCAFFTYIIKSPANSSLMNDMVRSYSFLPSALFFIYELFQKRNMKNIILFVLSISILVLAGTRGPMVCSVIFLFFCVIINAKKTKSYISVVLVSSVALIVLITNIYLTILQSLYSFLLSFGINNRVLYTLLNGEFTTSVERNVLLEKTINYTNSGSVFGRGIAGERVILGGYVHSLFFEVWCHYGYLIGTLLLMLLAIIIFRGYFKSRTANERFLFAILFSSSIVKLFLSGSYLNEALLWLLIGYSISVFRRTDVKLNFGEKNE